MYKIIKIRSGKFLILKQDNWTYIKTGLVFDEYKEALYYIRKQYPMLYKR